MPTSFWNTMWNNKDNIAGGASYLYNKYKGNQKTKAQNYRKAQRYFANKRLTVRNLKSYGGKFSMPQQLPEVRCIDSNFFKPWSAGNYTVDQLLPQVLPINAAGCLQALTNIQQGSGLPQRLGNRISLRSLRCRFNIQPTGQNYASVNNLRFIVLYDRAPNGAYLNPNNILNNILQDNTTVTGDYTDNLNPSYFDRIKVIKDVKMVLPPYQSAQLFNSNGPYDESNYVIDFYIKLKDLECVYTTSSNPAIVANSSVGSLQLFVFGDVAKGTEPWSLYGTTRLRFNGN
nr:MAG: capsid protein [Cressdnaviricota sp.]